MSRSIRSSSYHRILLASGLIAFIGPITAARADGGRGGNNGPAQGAGGGTGYNGASGGTGGLVQLGFFDGVYGGGGGGGAGGGSGGVAGYYGFQSQGGSGGTAASPNGGSGQNGGGGGGGYNGNGSGSPVVYNLGQLIGGNGGNGSGGAQYSDPYASYSSGGGGGGAGGYGAVVTSAGVSNTRGSIYGGQGGAGQGGGAGGDGGIGIYFTTPGATLLIDPIVGGGYVTGGNGGSGSSSGAGGVGVMGAGLTIDNAGAITGGMSADGSTRAYAVVLTGGINYLRGNGQYNGGIYVAGGTLQPSLPGSDVGAPLLVNGPLVFASSAAYQVRVTPTDSGRTWVTGTARLNGAAANIVIDTPITQATRYTILSATSGVGGTFSSVSTQSAFFLSALSYDATNVYATVVPINGGVVVTNFATGLTAAVPDYRAAAVSSNQLALASALTRANITRTANLPAATSNRSASTSTPAQANATRTADLLAAPSSAPTGVAETGAPDPGPRLGDRPDKAGKILASINQLSLPQARAVFDSLTGEGLAATQNVAYRSSALFTSAIFDQTTFYGTGAQANSVTLSEPAPVHCPIVPARTWRAWSSGFGGIEDFRGGAQGLSAQSDTIYGGALGVDYLLLPSFVVGAAVGGSDGRFTVTDRQTWGTTTGGHVALYDLATFGSFYEASSLALSVYDNRTNRNVDGFGDLAGTTERGSFLSREIRARLEVGRHVEAYGGAITPFVAMELAALRADGFRETTAGGQNLLGLDVAAQSSASAPAFLGARFETVVPLGRLVLSPKLELAYVHEFAPQRDKLASLDALPAASFRIDGARPASNAAHVKLGGDLLVGAGSVLFVNFDGEFAHASQFYAGKGGFRYTW